MKKYIFHVFLFFLGLTSCSKRLNHVTSPRDSDKICEKLNLLIYSPKVFQGAGGPNQKPVWIRLEFPENKLNEFLKNEKVMSGLTKSESSTLVASNQAESIVYLDNNFSASWIPHGYNISDGYTGNRKSLAMYRKQDINKIIIIISIFR